METAIPLFPCVSLDETLDFYQTLGFEVTFQQKEPYPYGAVCLGGVKLHFSRLTVYSPKNAFGTCLVFVPEVGPYHRTFTDALRVKYGQVPTACLPRITRLRQNQTRFKVFDPSGNLVIYINRDEPDAVYGWSEENLSELAQALENAVFLRDTYANDRSAAKVLDVALARHESADPVDRARALAARAELAVAMGETKLAQAIRLELQQIPLSDEDRNRFRHELQAGDDLERWLTQQGDRVGEA
jgi:catechol 2,3-dioxygenase-like lactoylglutathione lyase family enzyme